MDTRSRNIRYSAGAKLLAAFLVWFCFLSAAGSSVLILYNNNIGNSENYFHTYEANYEFSELVYNAVELNVKLKSEENIQASGLSERDTVNNLGRLRYIKDKINNAVNFAYYLKNPETGEVITNIKAAEPLELIKKQQLHVYSGQWEPRSGRFLFEEDIRQMLGSSGFEIYAAVMEPLKAGDVFYDGFIAYSRIKEMISFAYILLVASLLALVAAASYLAIVAGRKEKRGPVVYSFIDRLYTDVHTLLVFIAAFVSVDFVISGLGVSPNHIEFWVVFFIILGIDAAIGISYVLSMIRQAKGGRVLTNTLTFQGVRGLRTLLKLSLNGKLFKPSILVLILIYGLINGILFDLGVDLTNGYQQPIFTMLLLAFNIAVVYFTVKALSSLSQVMDAVKEISSGNLEYALKDSEISAAFTGLARDIRSLQGGLKKAVAEAVKGERMKTELITNVSHDLKTPLTSIVNYVDLLKKEELNNEKAAQYVGILEEKSARLKQLVEDLVEASKASSGNLAVKKEKVDLHELVLQACGEYEDKIKKAGLDIRINAGEKNTFINTDGRHMWRIIENLLSNVVKYSMANTRVYVSILKGDAFGILTIKNVSAFPLDIPPEQLTERFVRGDAARTTDGSGLGLSIAQSLTELQGGRFRIDIDGDLFKASVEMPLWIE